jgi:hypothetical protein
VWWIESSGLRLPAGTGEDRRARRISATICGTSIFVVNTSVTFTDGNISAWDLFLESETSSTSIRAAFTSSTGGTYLNEDAETGPLVGPWTICGGVGGAGIAPGVWRAVK